jgi:hypothetical protein
LSFNIIAANEGYGVRQLAAAFVQASLLAGLPPDPKMTAGKLADVKRQQAAALQSCAQKQKDLPALGVGPALLSKHGRRLDFSSHPVGPQGMGFCCAFSNPGLGEHSYPKIFDDRKQHKVPDDRNPSLPMTCASKSGAGFALSRE